MNNCSKRGFFPLIFFFLLSISVYSATYTTVISGPWNVASTWNCNCVPPTNGSNTLNIYHEIRYTGNYIQGGSSVLIIFPGGDLQISGTYTNQWSGSYLGIYNGGGLSASSITFTGSTTHTYHINGSLTSTIGDLSFSGDRQISFGSTVVVTSARDILVGTTSSSAIHTFNGTFSGRNFYHYQGSTITGSTTLNLTGDMYFYGNAKFYPSSINATLAGSFRIDQSARIDIGPGIINIGGNYNSVGGAFIEIDADINVSGNWLLGNGPTANFNGDVQVNGYFDKFGGAKMYINGDMIIDGSMTVRSGTDGDDVVIAEGSYLSATSLDVSGNSRITTNGFFDITTGNINATGAGKIVGTGVVGWSTFTTDKSGYIGCVNGTQWDNHIDTGTKPYPPANPLDLTTCGPGVLPVELISFAVKSTGRIVTVDWSTISENNSEVFIIEKSSDGMNFTAVGEIAAAGFSNSLLNYSFQDTEVTGSNLYYRLVIKDKDGTLVYSQVVYIKTEKSGFVLFPNPTDGVSLNVTLNSTSASEVSIKVTDLSGKTLYDDVTIVEKGFLKLQFSNKLLPGLYIISVQSNSDFAEEKFAVY